MTDDLDAIAAELEQASVLVRNHVRILLAERRRMKTALTQIADQRLYEEVSPDKRDSHEWSEGFDQCVMQARYALKGKP